MKSPGKRLAILFLAVLLLSGSAQASPAGREDPIQGIGRFFERVVHQVRRLIAAPLDELTGPKP